MGMGSGGWRVREDDAGCGRWKEDARKSTYDQ
jgi:hypothetical protein